MTLFYDVGITVEGAGGAVKQMVEVTWSGTEQWPAMCPGPWGQATGARRRLRAGVRCHACCGRCYPGRFPDRGCARSRSDLSWLKITGSGSSRPTDLGFRAAAVVGLRPTGHNSAVAADDDGTGAFRGASFTGADFTGANFRDCDLRQVKITDSWLVDLSLSGLVGKLVVNDVDVTALVEGELDRRHPERVQLRGKPDRRRLPRDVGRDRAPVGRDRRPRRAATRTWNRYARGCPRPGTRRKHPRSAFAWAWS
jgi:hypothetical protein